MEKIAILNIATGRYSSFFENLKNDVLQKFLPNYHKDFFLFTDQSIINDPNCSVFLKLITHLPWPLNTLLRFNYFKSIESELERYDLIYYIDCDVTINDVIDEEVVPKNDEIVAVKHYWHENQIGSYETKNLLSTAYVDPSMLGLGNYCQACFFGAGSKRFISMINELDENVKTDLKSNIIAIWHDESHLNKYLLNNPCKRLHTGYAHPTVCDSKDNTNQIKMFHYNFNTFKSK